MNEIHLFFQLALIAVACVPTCAKSPEIRERYLITSPKACVSNLDCSPTSFCKFSELTRCVTRKDINQECGSTHECKDDLFCKFRKEFGTSVCQKKLPMDASCDPHYYGTCAGSAVCSLSAKKCTTSSGQVGASCEFNSDCRDGMYCSSRGNHCMLKKNSGTNCMPYGTDNKCEGFCSGAFPNSAFGICIQAQKEGQPCRSDDHCKGENSREGETVGLICNTPSTMNAGLCILESKLLKRLGMGCNPKRDHCDFRRGLSCHFDKVQKRFVCHQGYADDTESYCTPGNRLGECKHNKVPMVCKRDDYSGVFRCVERKDEIIPRGLNCRRGVCENGTSCEEVTGILRWAYKGPPAPSRFCVKVIGFGEKCDNKFRTQCTNGFKCANGKCVKGSPRRDLDHSHADLWTSCVKLPCVPGLKCKLSKDPLYRSAPKRPLCLLPEQIMQYGFKCYNDGLVTRVS